MNNLKDIKKAYKRREGSGAASMGLIIIIGWFLIIYVIKAVKNKTHKKLMEETGDKMTDNRQTTQNDEDINNFINLKKKQRWRQFVKYIVFVIFFYVIGIGGHVFYYSADRVLMYDIEKNELDPYMFLSNYVGFVTDDSEHFLIGLFVLVVLSLIFFLLYTGKNLYSKGRASTFKTQEEAQNTKRKGNQNDTIYNLLKYLCPVVLVGSFFVLSEYFFISLMTFEFRYFGCLFTVYLYAIYMACIGECDEYGYKRNRYKVVLPVLIFLLLPVLFGFSVADSVKFSSDKLFKGNTTCLYLIYAVVLLYLVSLSIYEIWQRDEGKNNWLNHVFYFLSAAAIGAPIIFASAKISADSIWENSLCMDWLVLMSMVSMAIMIKHWAEVIKKQGIMKKCHILDEKNVVYFEIDILNQFSRMGIAMLVSFVLMLVAVLNSKYYFFTMFTYVSYLYMYTHMIAKTLYDWHNLYITKEANGTNNLEAYFPEIPKDFFVYKYIIPFIIVITMLLDRGVGNVTDKVFIIVHESSIVIYCEVVLSIVLILSIIMFPYIVVNYYLKDKITRKSRDKSEKSSGLVTVLSAFIMVFANRFPSDSPIVDSENVQNTYSGLDGEGKQIWMRIVVTEIMTGIILAILFIYLTGLKNQIGLVLFAEFFTTFFIIYDSYKVKANMLMMLLQFNKDKKNLQANQNEI